jgi:hypothetical protein
LLNAKLGQEEDRLAPLVVVNSHWGKQFHGSLVAEEEPHLMQHLGTAWDTPSVYCQEVAAMYL